METKLTHYIIVRRDLPLGTLAAMVTHAAGESGFLFKKDSIFQGATAVVLEVKTEMALYKAALKLIDNTIPHIRVVESEGQFQGQLMAIGVVPLIKDERIAKLMEPFQLLKKLDTKNEPCNCSNCRALFEHETIKEPLHEYESIL